MSLSRWFSIVLICMFAASPLAKAGDVVLPLDGTVLNLTLKIGETSAFKLVLSKTTLIRFTFKGDIFKEVTGGYHASPRVQLNAVDGSASILSWAGRMSPYNGIGPGFGSETMIVAAGSYDVVFAADINGWSAAEEYKKDSATFVIQTSVLGSEGDDQVVSAINGWLDGADLMSHIRVAAVLEGPEFAFGDRKEDPLGIRKILLSASGDWEELLDPGIDPEKKKKRLEFEKKRLKDRVYILLYNNLDREELGALEANFNRKHNATIWTRILSKAALFTGRRVKDMQGYIPVPCSASVIRVGAGGEADRWGSECMSASDARVAPDWLSQNLASAASEKADGSPKKDFAASVEKFLDDEVAALGGSIEYLTRDETYVEVIVRGVRGWVVNKGTQWERIQITFALFDSEKNPRIRLIVDGLLASGIGNNAPQDSKFVSGFEPEYSSELTRFTKSTLESFISKGKKK